MTEEGPPMTTPFSDGGPPQSQVAPGDSYRELIHEVRNLTTQVSLLHTIFVRRKILYTFLGIELAVIAAVVAVLFVLVNTTNSHESALVAKIIGSCDNRNQQSLGTDRLIQDQLKINQEELNHLPKAQITPFVRHIETEFVTSLNRWKDSQPAPVKCSEFKP